MLNSQDACNSAQLDGAGVRSKSAVVGFGVTLKTFLAEGSV